LVCFVAFAVLSLSRTATSFRSKADGAALLSLREKIFASLALMLAVIAGLRNAALFSWSRICLLRGGSLKDADSG
jgi:hypothetical protein